MEGYLCGYDAAANALIQADNPKMTDEVIAFAIDTMKTHGIIFSGEALITGAGALADAKIEDFFRNKAAVGAVPADLD